MNLKLKKFGPIVEVRLELFEDGRGCLVELEGDKEGRGPLDDLAERS